MKTYIHTLQIFVAICACIAKLSYYTASGFACQPTFRTKHRNKKEGNSFLLRTNQQKSTTLHTLPAFNSKRISPTVTGSAIVALLMPFFLSLLSLTLPARAEVDVTRGSQIFTSNCSSCHIQGLNIISEKRTLKKEALQKFIGGVDEASVQKFVKGSMRHKTLVFPNVPGGKLSDGDWDDVVGFVVDQAIDDKW
mmetsp:Transcript_27647/g.33621  ORF Transcript_27647/g.33621 Transcript_27647/m.33621 type:complete len:194 (+) Transcript_27647:72-653(+)